CTPIWTSINGPPSSYRPSVRHWLPTVLSWPGISAWSICKLRPMTSLPGVLSLSVLKPPRARRSTCKHNGHFPNVPKYCADASSTLSNSSVAVSCPTLLLSVFNESFIDELIHPVTAELTADTGLLDTTKW